MNRLVVRNARLLDPATRLDQVGDLLVLDGRIADLGSVGPVSGARVVDATGWALMPGLIDLRVASREPGAEHIETLASLADAAVAGGVTTAAVLPATDPPIEEPALVELILRQSDRIGRARLRPWAALTRGFGGQVLAEMGLLSAAGAIGFSDGGHPVAHAGVMRRALAYARTFDRPVMNHPSDPGLVGVATEGELATRAGLSATPAIAERMMLERDLALVALTGGRYHAGPITTAAGVAAIRRAKQDGLPVTADTALPYIALNEVAIADYRTDVKVWPPLRSEADRQAVVAGLADGTLDALSSDHQPHDADAKRLPYSHAAAGIAGVETLLVLALEQVHTGSVGLLDMLARLTTGPGSIIGSDAGRLARGCPADLVLVDLDRPWRIDADAFRSKARNTPFHRRPVQGRIIATVVGGEAVFGTLP
ncbi:MAG: dihydroorotase [Alphaproteobacteria bacterium]|nr:MAG: dihydroorotase [Alphaproteobacteria bacterium]